MVGGKRASPQREPHRRTLCLHLQVCVCNHHHHHHVQFQLHLLSLGHIKHAHAPQRNTGARPRSILLGSLLQMRMRFHCIDLRILSIPQSHTCAHNVTTLATVTDGPSLSSSANAAVCRPHADYDRQQQQCRHHAIGGPARAMLRELNVNSSTTPTPTTAARSQGLRRACAQVSVTGAMTKSSGSARRLNVVRFLFSSSLFRRRPTTMRAISERRREPALGANPETPGKHLDLFGTHASNTARLRAEVASLDIQRQQVASVALFDAKTDDGTREAPRIA